MLTLNLITYFVFCPRNTVCCLGTNKWIQLFHNQSIANVFWQTTFTFFNVLGLVQTHCQIRMLYFICIKRESGTNEGWKGGLSISSPSSGHSCCARTNVQIWDTAQICLSLHRYFSSLITCRFMSGSQHNKKPPAGRIQLPFFYCCNWGFRICLMVHIQVLVKIVHHVYKHLSWKTRFKLVIITRWLMILRMGRRKTLHLNVE